MLLAIDIGNTSTAVAVYDGEERAAAFRVASDRDRLPDEWAALLASLLRGEEIAPVAIGAAAISATVPSVGAACEAACARAFGVRPLIVSAEVQAGVPVRCDNPAEVGPDRILHAVAALHRHSPPLLVIDFGTALVFDAVDREGDYLGGAIAPGVGVASQALAAAAAMLRPVPAGPPPGESVIGRNTAHAMQAGTFYGYAELVRGMVRRFKDELGDDATVIATGGWATGLAEAAGCVDAVEPDLNLEGLRLVHEAHS